MVKADGILKMPLGKATAALPLNEDVAVIVNISPSSSVK